MKKLIILLGSSSLILLSGCSKSTDPTVVAAAACSGPYTGTWTGTTQADSLTFNADCSFGYIGVGGACASTGTYASAINAASGTVAVTIVTKTGSSSGACLPIGSASCIYAISGTSSPQHLSYNCNGGGTALSYQK